MNDEKVNIPQNLLETEILSWIITILFAPKIFTIHPFKVMVIAFFEAWIIGMIIWCLLDVYVSKKRGYIL